MITTKLVLRDDDGTIVGVVTQELPSVHLEHCNSLKTVWERQQAAFRNATQVIFQVEDDIRKKYAAAATTRWIRML